MPTIHFLNVLEGDCNIIQHSSGRVTVMDVSNAYNEEFTDAELAAKESKERENRRNRTNVPSDKKDYKQKRDPDNPITYLKDNARVSSVFRFLISHPDMDHLDGLKDFYTEFSPTNTWDTDNNKEIDSTASFAGYNKDDWDFYLDIRNGSYTDTKRLTYLDPQAPCDFWNKDGLHILAPSAELLRRANTNKDYNDASIVVLYLVARKDKKPWKILFTGDSEDDTWNHLLENHKDDIADADVLLAPHHGRDSGRDYTFLETVKPRVTLFGNASSKHLAYSKYPPIRITNNQAGYVVIDIAEEAMTFYVKNYEFARDFRAKGGWGEPTYSVTFKAWDLFKFDA